MTFRRPSSTGDEALGSGARHTGSKGPLARLRMVVTRGVLLGLLAGPVVIPARAGAPDGIGIPAVAGATRATPAVATARRKPLTTGAVAAIASTPAPIGGLFATATDPEHYCTASVIDSPERDLLLTAAHCVSGRATALSFVPGYDQGREPYGRWRVVAAFAAPAWLDGQDPQDDAVFLEVAPRQVDGHSVEIQQVTGGYVLGAAPAAGTRVTVVGYASGKDDTPIRCVASVYFHEGYPAFDCDGYVGGTSGSPWLTVERGRADVVHGVIGGLNQGGCSPNTSYSSPFGATIAGLYRTAVEATSPSTLPRAGPAGC